MENNLHRTRTLWLCTVLHGFTHLYHVALIPLYLLIKRDFGLENDAQVTLLVTVMAFAYFLPSYPVGMLADRWSRRKLLCAGLALNGLGFVGLALAPNYLAAFASLLLAGFGGSFYHPAATGLIARLFPVGTGRALGLVGIGAGIGFFIGPLYAGWRAEMAGWRAPVLELGLAGIAGALLFAIMTREEPRREPVAHHASVSPLKLFSSPMLWIFFFAATFAFCLRDFAANGMSTLTSLFLQRAHDFNPTHTGLALSCIFLAAIISNPLLGSLSDRGRGRWTGGALTIAALTIMLLPRITSSWLIPTLAVYGFFLMATYPMVEAALMESIDDSVRGRVFGLFITVGGLVGNLSHWLVGYWVKELGAGADDPASYIGIFNLLGILVLVSLAGVIGLRGLRKHQSASYVENAPTRIESK